MNERNIFNHALTLDIFCMDIAEDWIKYQKANNQPVNSYEFMDWVDEFAYALECNFDCVYESECERTEE